MIQSIILFEVCGAPRLGELPGVRHFRLRGH